MDFKQLRYFLAVVDELSFTKAARSVGIAQPSLSAQIRALEEEIGAALFRRDTRSVALTPEGDALIPYARHILKDAGRAIIAVRSIRDGQQGRVAVGAVCTAIYVLMPRVIRAITLEHPRVKVQVEEMTLRQQLQALKAETIDVGIFRGSVTDPDIVVRAMNDGAVVVALPADHLLARRIRISPADLLDEPFISFTNKVTSDFVVRIREFFLRNGSEPKIAHEVTDIHTLIALIGAGLGVSLVPASTAALRPPYVVFRPLAGEAPRAITHVGWHRENRSPLRSLLVSQIEKAAEWEAKFVWSLAEESKPSTKPKTRLATH